MTLEEALRILEALGTEQNRKVYRRHGAGENLYGVSFANLEKLRKRIGHDHRLARSLWRTGNADARALSVMIAEPTEMSAAEIESWLRDTTYYGLVDLFIGHVASQHPDAAKLRDKWRKSRDEWVGQAGWGLVALAAMHDESLPDSYFADSLQTIERDIHSAKNRTRHAMNNALIAIGIRNAPLRRQAIAAAKRIGKVVVDHGETGCKTPDAVAYIEKTKAHRSTVAAKRAGKARAIADKKAGKSTRATAGHQTRPATKRHVKKA